MIKGKVNIADRMLKLIYDITKSGFRKCMASYIISMVMFT